MSRASTPMLCTPLFQDFPTRVCNLFPEVAVLTLVFIMEFIMTVDSDEDENQTGKRSKKLNNDQEAILLNPEFQFELVGDPYANLLLSEAEGTQDIVNKISQHGADPVSVEEIITRRKLKRKRVDEYESESGTSESTEHHAEGSKFLDGEEDDRPEVTSEEEESVGDSVSQQDSVGDNDDDLSGDSEIETQAEKDRKAAFFDSEMHQDSHSSFLTMNLSRPLQKALTSLGFVSPTPIQAATIPVALLGKDVVGNAVTGSGKTAAFTIPILERLLYREKGNHATATRCLILVPTRELAVQCFEVGSKLAAYTDIRFCLAAGGLSVKSQEATLRTRPDVVIATPGRLIDHLRNSPAFTLDALDVLVLDEADRMLSEGFADELNEIIKSCPVSRQTMLFSATMTDSVDELVKMSLNKPVRLFVDPKRTMAKGLIQEFVRVRAGKESNRTALLVSLCKRTFKQRVIVFFRSKKLAHQVRVMFSLLGMNAEELHGDLSQEQRLKALQSFRDGQADYLMATDLASRGLDIKGIETVINYDMPGQLEQYLHRVGRTARAGKSGRSITLVGESDRKILKSAMKHSASDDDIRHRVIPVDVMLKWSKKVEELKSEVSAVLQEEKEEKQLRQAEMELKKGHNMLEHEAEIFSRPARTWFQTEKERARAAGASRKQHESDNPSGETGIPPKLKRDKYAGLSRKAKRRKMAIEAEKEPGQKGAIDAAIRSAKRQARPGKVGKIQTKNTTLVGQRKTSKVSSRTGSVFNRDLSAKKNTREGIRAKKGDAIGSMGRGKGGKR
ncbi:P-loop containing nucleoside triphosphate hydrolase protein [Scleroderma yunnanense]